MSSFMHGDRLWDGNSVPVIGVVSANPAIDITLTIPRDHPSTTHRRAEHESARAGGKGANAAHVIAALAGSATLMPLLGGALGRAFIEMTADPVHVVPAFVAGETRCCVTVIGGDEMPVEFLGPGCEVSGSEWDAYLDVITGASTGCDQIAISGSLPPGVPASAMADLLAATAREGRNQYVDSSGPALAAAVTHGDVTIFPNEAELEELCAAFGLTAQPTNSVRREALESALGELAQFSNTRSIATLGSRGAATFHEEGTITATAPAVSGNPVGAGDATLAAFVLAEAMGRDIVDSLRWGVAAGAAAVGEPHAGVVDRHRWATMIDRVTVTKL